MCKQLICLTGVVLMMGFAGSAVAGNDFTNGSGDSQGDNPANWSAGVVPQDSTTDPGDVDPPWHNDILVPDGETMIIDETMTIAAYGVHMGAYGAVSGVNMTGGSLTVGDWGMNIGRGDVQTGSFGTFQMSGGILNASYVNLPQQWGTNSEIGGEWIMDGGVANVGWLRLGGDTGSGTGTLELNDGVINLASHLDIGGTDSLIDIEGGVLNIHHVDFEGSLQATLDAIQGWIDADYITAYGGTGAVGLNYDLGTENISIWVPEPATLSLLLVGGLFLRRKK